MRLEEVTAELRPRGDWEAVDLGFAMARRDFWRCWLLWWMAMLVPGAAIALLVPDQPIFGFALLWWLKPIGSRLVIFQLSRRLFGESPRWGAVWREIPRAWFRRFFGRMVLRRLSPWLPVTLPIEELEGLRGKAYRQRAKQVVRRGEGAITWVYFLSDLATAWLGFGIFALVTTFIPEGRESPWTEAILSWDASRPMAIPPLIVWSVLGCMVVAMSLSDVFFTAAGFGIYVNNRTWLEGWDVELAFRRLGRRLSGASVLLLAGLVFFHASPALRAQEVDAGTVAESAEETAAAVIARVKSHPDFKEHSVTRKVPEINWPDWLSGGAGSGRGWGRYLPAVGMVMGYTVAAAVVGWIIWMIWRNRTAFKRRGGKDGALQAPRARVVMGMEVSPESLPDDVPAAVWKLWESGRRHEALSLLYRGAISAVIEMGPVEIRESDTEGDCMRRVAAAGAPAHPDYFRGLTQLWVGLAYAAIEPADADVRALCHSWPFGERRVS